MLRIGLRVPGIDTARGLGHEPQQRLPIAALEGARRGIDLLDGREGRGAAEHDDGELRGIGFEGARLAVAVEGARGERLAAQLLEHRLDVRHGAAGEARTGR